MHTLAKALPKASLGMAGVLLVAVDQQDSKDTVGDYPCLMSHH
ncbi:hypothetical protein [Gemmatimonas sp.]